MTSPSEKLQGKLQGKTVVITGASSGNGRAMALEFAREGANVVLAARRIHLLEEVARECEALGARALPVETDVSIAGPAAGLADAALREFGKIDIWINNAGVGALGELDQVPLESHEQVIQTNLIAAIRGAHAVLPHFKRQRQGILIQTNSVGAWVPFPFAAAYTASKHGLRGLSEELRTELVGYPEIHVCELFPAFVDTPAVKHAANYEGKKLRNPIGAGDPLRVARAAVQLAKSPRDKAPVMLTTVLARVAYFLAPALLRQLLARGGRLYLSRAGDMPKTDGNLFQPVEEGRGIYAEPRRMHPSPAQAKWMTAGFIGALAGALLLTRRGRSRLKQPSSSLQSPSCTSA